MTTPHAPTAPHAPHAPSSDSPAATLLSDADDALLSDNPPPTPHTPITPDAAAAQLADLTGAIESRVGRQRFNVWFAKSAKLDLKSDKLEISVPNDFISEWITRHFSKSIQDAAHEVLGCSLPVTFTVAPRLFELEDKADARGMASAPGETRGRAVPASSVGPLPAGLAGAVSATAAPRTADAGFDAPLARRPRLRHDLDTFIVGGANQVAYQCARHVAEHPGTQYNPLFIHGPVGLGKTHLLQGLCKAYAKKHPTGRWVYLTGEEFTNAFLSALRTNKLDAFRRKMRDLDLLVIDDVHFLGGKKATQEEFLHTFNAIEAVGRQVVLASDNHPKLIEAFGESLINRFISGMTVRVDPPNLAMRRELLSVISKRAGLQLPAEVLDWVATRVTQNVRELEGAVTRLRAHVQLTGRVIDVELARECLADLDRAHGAPIQPEAIMATICEYFGLEKKDLMSGRRQRTVSLARSVAMYLIRKTSKLSFPEIANRLGKRNHSTVISACRRVEKALERNEPMSWTSSVGDRTEEARELVARLEEMTRARG